MPPQTTPVTSPQPTFVHIWQWTFQVGDLLTAALLFVAIGTLLITLRQIVRGNRAQQAAVFKEAYLGAFAQLEMLQALSVVERNQFKASIDHGASTPKQDVQVNMLLGFANCVCAMHELKLMSKHELRHFTYFLRVLYLNESVQTYCRFLKVYMQHKTGDDPVRPYRSWVDYCSRAFKLPDLYGTHWQGGKAAGNHGATLASATGDETPRQKEVANLSRGLLRRRLR